MAIIYLRKQMRLATSNQDRPALTDVVLPAASIEAGVTALRDWMSENWSAIQDGGEPEIRDVVRALLLLGHTCTYHHR